MSSPLLPHLEKFVADAQQTIVREKVESWMRMGITKAFRIEDFQGRAICYEGIEFEGSPRHVFWGEYIEPFLEDLVLRTIEETRRFAESRNHSPRKGLLVIRRLLKDACRHTFRRMGEIDQRLVEYNGVNATIQGRIDKGIEAMNAFIDRRIDAELAMLGWWSELNAFYKRNPAVTLIASGVLSSLVTYFLKGR